MHISISYTTLLAALAQVLTTVSAQDCPGALVPGYAQPVFADGWTGNLIAEGLKRPRGLQVDSLGNLLVVEQGTGIVHLQFTDAGGTCLTLAKQTTLIADTAVSIVIILMEILRLFRRGFCWPSIYLFASCLFSVFYNLLIYSLGQG